jgi:hypothetical protein
MKQSLTKRIVSGLLIVLMVLTMIPSELIPVMHVHAADNINDKYNLIIDFDYASKNNVTSPEEAMALEKKRPWPTSTQQTAADGSRQVSRWRRSTTVTTRPPAATSASGWKTPS